MKLKYRAYVLDHKGRMKDPGSWQTEFDTAEECAEFFRDDHGFREFVIVQIPMYDSGT